MASTAITGPQPSPGSSTGGDRHGMGGLRLPLQPCCSCSHPERTLMLGMWGDVPARCTAPIPPHPSAQAPCEAGGSSASHARDASCHSLGTEHPEARSSFVIYELFVPY